MDWRHKLTKTEKKHLREMGIRTKQDLLNAIEYQRKNECRCFDCSHIAVKLNLK